MTDRIIANAVNRIYRYLIKMERLPRSMYSKPDRARYEIRYIDQVELTMCLIEQSGHLNVKEIVSVLRNEIAAGKIRSIAASIHPHLIIPSHWLVENHQLHYFSAHRYY